ncbi:rod shape-determining protein RodA [Candidatus Hydrogenedentota bacterium]
MALLKKLDRTLLIAMALLLLAGVLTIYSAKHARGDHSLHARQLMWIAVGLFAMLAATAVDYRLLLALSPFLYAVNVMLLLYLLVGVEATRGARSWFDFKFIRFQPAEFCKLAVIVTLAQYLGWAKLKIHSFRFFTMAGLIVAVPMAFIAKQPDFGTAMVFFPVFLVMVFMSGARKRHLAIVVAPVLAFIIIIPLLQHVPPIWNRLEPYQQGRLLAFVDPDTDPLGTGYNAIQAKIAVGGGQLAGHGWLEGPQTQRLFLPEAHTDFVFCVFAEEWGFIFSVGLLVLYSIVIGKGLLIAYGAIDTQGTFLAMGIVTLLAFHTVFSIGMAMGLLPITGIPLPFMSYGGSFMVVVLISIGLLLNVKLRSLDE